MVSSEEQLSRRVLEGKKIFSDAWVYWIGNSAPESLLHNFATGLPDSWSLHLPSPDSRENLYVDRTAGPSLLAKVRTPHSADFLNIKALDLPDELKLAYDLGLVLRKEGAQSIAQHYGYQDVQLVSPVCAVKERKRKKREFFVFPFIKNAQTVLSRFRTPIVRHLEEVGEDLAVDLGDHLYGCGFYSHDFGSHQLLVAGDRGGKHLYIIDSEDFRRV